MIKEIVALKRANQDARQLVVPASRHADLIQAIRDVQSEFSDKAEIVAVETFMGLAVRLGAGDRLLVL